MLNRTICTLILLLPALGQADEEKAKPGPGMKPAAEEKTVTSRGCSVSLVAMYIHPPSLSICSRAWMNSWIKR